MFALADNLYVRNLRETQRSRIQAGTQIGTKTAAESAVAAGILALEKGQLKDAETDFRKAVGNEPSVARTTTG